MPLCAQICVLSTVLGLQSWGYTRGREFWQELFSDSLSGRINTETDAHTHLKCYNLADVGACKQNDEL